MIVVAVTVVFRIAVAVYYYDYYCCCYYDYSRHVDDDHYIAVG